MKSLRPYVLKGSFYGLPLWWLSCKGCMEGICNASSAADLAIKAAEQGWKVRYGLVYCRTCAKK